MDLILDRMAEFIVSYIWFHYDKEKVNSPTDVLYAIEEGDGFEDLKDQLWYMFRYELPLSNIVEEIERRKQLEKENEPEDSDEENNEDEMNAPNDSDSDGY
jgi:hypothetical protein